VYTKTQQQLTACFCWQDDMSSSSPTETLSPFTFCSTNFNQSCRSATFLSNPNSPDVDVDTTHTKNKKLIITMANDK